MIAVSITVFIAMLSLLIVVGVRPPETGMSSSSTPLHRRPSMHFWPPIRRCCSSTFASLSTCWPIPRSFLERKEFRPKKCWRIPPSFRRRKTRSFTVPAQAIKPASASCIVPSPCISRGSNSSKVGWMAGKRRAIQWSRTPSHSISTRAVRIFTICNRDHDFRSSKYRGSSGSFLSAPVRRAAILVFTTLALIDQSCRQQRME